MNHKVFIQSLYCLLLLSSFTYDSCVSSINVSMFGMHGYGSYQHVRRYSPYEYHQHNTTPDAHAIPPSTLLRPDYSVFRYESRQHPPVLKQPLPFSPGGTGGGVASALGHHSPSTAFPSVIAGVPGHHYSATLSCPTGAVGAFHVATEEMGDFGDALNDLFEEAQHLPGEQQQQLIQQVLVANAEPIPAPVLAAVNPNQAQQNAPFGMGGFGIGNLFLENGNDYYNFYELFNENNAEPIPAPVLAAVNPNHAQQNDPFGMGGFGIGNLFLENGNDYYNFYELFNENNAEHIPAHEDVAGHIPPADQPIPIHPPAQQVLPEEQQQPVQPAAIPTEINANNAAHIPAHVPADLNADNNPQANNPNVGNNPALEEDWINEDELDDQNLEQANLKEKKPKRPKILKNKKKHCVKPKHKKGKVKEEEEKEEKEEKPENLNLGPKIEEGPNHGQAAKTFKEALNTKLKNVLGILSKGTTQAARAKQGKSTDGTIAANQAIIKNNTANIAASKKVNNNKGVESKFNSLNESLKKVQLTETDCAHLADILNPLVENSTKEEIEAAVSAAQDFLKEKKEAIEKQKQKKAIENYATSNDQLLKFLPIDTAKMKHNDKKALLEKAEKVAFACGINIKGEADLNDKSKQEDIVTYAKAVHDTIIKKSVK